MSNFTETQINIIKETISDVFAKPESEQPAAWEHIIEFMEEFSNRPDGNKQGRKAAIEARNIYISIAKEAKYFG